MKIGVGCDAVVFKELDGRLNYVGCDQLYVMMKLHRTLKAWLFDVVEYDDDTFLFSNRRIRR